MSPHGKADAAADGELMLEAEGGSCSLGGTRGLSSLPASCTSPLQPHLAFVSLVDITSESYNT